MEESQGMELEKAKLAYRIAEFLNEVLAMDPVGISNLFRLRAEVNPVLAAHPTVQVGYLELRCEACKGTGHDSVHRAACEECAAEGRVVHKDRFDVGTLGLLNGLVGTDSVRLAIFTEPDFYDEGSETVIDHFEATANFPEYREDAEVNHGDEPEQEEADAPKA